MKTKEKTQIQIRIDSKTKSEAKKVLEEIGMDVSTAINILFKYIAKSGAFPIDLRDVNGFRAHKARELSKAIVDVSQSGVSFKNTKELLADLRS